MPKLNTSSFEIRRASNAWLIAAVIVLAVLALPSAVSQVLNPAKAGCDVKIIEVAQQMDNGMPPRLSHYEVSYTVNGQHRLWEIR